MNQDDDLRGFQNLVRTRLAAEARDFEEILRRLPEGWETDLAERVVAAVKQGFTGVEIHLVEPGFKLTLHLTYELGYGRGGD